MKRIVNVFLCKLNRGKRAYGVFVLFATTAIVLTAQTLTTLHSFNGTDGAYPYSGLVQATNGDLYGTTPGGGTNNDCFGAGCGTIFKITPSGTFTTIYNFCSQPGCTDGWSPYGTLVQATNGDLYGTTESGGPETGGTVFKITPSGTLTTLYAFCFQIGCTGGQRPYSGLVQATNGDLYGTTSEGGANCTSESGCGTVFKITPSGTLTTLYSFCSQSDCMDGETPDAGLSLATNGNLYGTTFRGGAGGYKSTIFKVTPGGTLTTLYRFCAQSGCPDGWGPYAPPVQATNGNFYGPTFYGGVNPGSRYGYGTIYEITPSGLLTTLYNFCSQSGCTDGYAPDAGLVQSTNGTFYGTTSNGGANGYGTVFSLSVGLGPFVEAQPTSGQVGSAVKILGTNLIGATSVTFNTTAAVFTVVSPSEITTSVPTGATTGTVQVLTSSGTLSSNVPFRVP